jgi:glycosyltransferase involved in cell wall biosynthesis
MTAAGRIPLRVVWISDSAPAGLTTDIAYFESHRQASLRFRVGIPARALHAIGVQSAFIGLDTPAVLEHLAPERVDAVVFAKLSTPRGPTYEAFTTAYLGTARHARARGLPVVVDLVDNVFATDRREFFVEMVASADAVTVCSEALAEVCQDQCDAPVSVIADPVEGDRQPARFAPPRATALARLGLGRPPPPLRLLWFGGQYRSFLDLVRVLPQLTALARTRPLELAVVASADARVASELEAFAARCGAALATRFTEWSLQAVAEALDRCDLVLLPADLHDEMRATASANRLIRAIWAGRAVVAHPVASYQAFQDAALLSGDLAHAIDWALAHPGNVLRRIEMGQAIVSQSYCAEAIATRWLEVLASAIARSSPDQAVVRRSPSV